MNTSVQSAFSKLLEVPLAFWVIKIAATTLGFVSVNTVSSPKPAMFYFASAPVFALILASICCSSNVLPERRIELP
jgi:uncharacterized membrane-anchored protein